MGNFHSPHNLSIQGNINCDKKKNFVIGFVIKTEMGIFHKKAIGSFLKD